MTHATRPTAPTVPDRLRLFLQVADAHSPMRAQVKLVSVLSLTDGSVNGTHLFVDTQHVGVKWIRC